MGHLYKGSPANELRLLGFWARSYLGGIIGIPNFTLSFFLTFERILREGGLLESSLEVDYFSVLEEESDLYEF